MSGGAREFSWPYTPTPGGSTPSPTMEPKEGVADLWGFAGLSVLSTVIIAVVGVAIWAVVH